MAYYKQHVFVCTNKRTDGRACCEDHGADEMRAYLKKKVKDANLAGLGRIRINDAGCLDRCGQGPVLVVYPDETWYRYESKKDLDEIFEQHLNKNQNVQRLLI